MSLIEGLDSSPATSPWRPAKAELLGLLSEKRRRTKRNQLSRYRPYPKQLEFHTRGATYRERLLMAANKVGKTLAGACEMAMHLTGQYPDWWEGRRFTHPIAALAGSETSEVTRRGVQRLLVGPPESEADWGTGFIPGDAIIDAQRRRGVPDALDSVVVKHTSGGNSTLGFKAYEQGRKNGQADDAHVVWFDEEPPQDVYSEGLTRINATGGLVYLTFTPLLGVSEVVHRFMTEKSPDRIITQMTIADAAHIPEARRKQIEDSYPEHEREARVKGIPSLGSGRVFPVTEASIVIDPVPIPKHWAQIVGVDFGWDHPFAAVSCAWDRDADVWYVTKTYRESKATPPIHAAAVRPWGDWIPIAWPQDGLQTGKSDGLPLAKLYRDQGLKFLAEHATHETGGVSVEARLIGILERMPTARF